MKYCTHCGNKLKDNDNFCSNCGHRQDATIEEPKEIESNNTESNNQESSNPESSNPEPGKLESNNSESNNSKKNKQKKTYEKKKSVLGVWAIILSIIPGLHILGRLFALIDILFRRKKAKIGCAIAALIIGFIWTGLLTYELFPLFKTYRIISDCSQGQSSLVSKGLEKTDDPNSYIVKDHMTKIKGHSYFDSNLPNTIEYKLTMEDGYEIASGEMKYKKNWTINSKGLSIGGNNLHIEYKFDDPDKNKEVDYYIYNTNQKNSKNLKCNKIDSDSDGLTDYFEKTNSFTDINNKDSNSNGINDGDEDLDYDCLTNIEEQKNNSFSLAMDSDGDGITDGDEIKVYSTNLLKEDTDGDSISDYYEIEMGTDPNNKKDPVIGQSFEFKEEKTFASGLVVNIDMETAPENIPSFRIYEIPDSYKLSSRNIDGMIGTAIGFEMNGQPSKANVEITLDCDDYIPGEKYALYYFNEETYNLEYVEEQTQNGGKIIASLPHFSDYVVKKGENVNVEILKSIHVQFQDDEVDGLYNTYDEYLENVYLSFFDESNQPAILSIHIYPPLVDSDVARAKNSSGLLSKDISSQIIRLNWSSVENSSNGHTWMSYYYKGNKHDFSISKIIDSNLVSNRLTNGCNPVNGKIRKDGWMAINQNDDYRIVFGAFGYGGWKHTPFSPIGQLTKEWDAELKLPSQYKNLSTSTMSEYGEGDDVENSSSSSNDGILNAENANDALISLPFIIFDEEKTHNLSSFLITYNKKYDVDKNNCTTFAREALYSANIKNSINFNYNDIIGNPHIENFYVGMAGSPGQASYSIQKEYPEEHVYRLIKKEYNQKKVDDIVLGEGESVAWFTSELAQKYALREDREYINELKAEQEKIRQRKETLKKALEVLCDDQETEYIIMYSSLGTILGLPVLIFENGGEDFNYEKQNDVQELLDSLAIIQRDEDPIFSKTDTLIKYTYYNINSDAFEKIKENIPERYQYKSIDELQKTVSGDSTVLNNKGIDIGEWLTYNIFLIYGSVNTSPTDFYKWFFGEDIIKEEKEQMELEYTRFEDDRFEEIVTSEVNNRLMNNED